MLCWQPSVQERLWKNNFMGHLSRKVKLKKTKVHIKCSQVRKMDQARTDKRGGLTTLVLIFFNVRYLFIYVNIFYVLLIQKLSKIKCDLHCDSSWKYLSAQNEWKVIPAPFFGLASTLGFRVPRPVWNSNKIFHFLI